MKCDWLKPRLLGGALIAALAWPAVADESKPKAPADQPAAEKSAEKNEAGAAEEKKEETPDPFAVPEGSPKELADYIKGLQKMRIRDFETYAKLRTAALEAADKILAGKPDDQERDLALEMKIRFLFKREELEKLAEELKQNGPQKFVRPLMTKIWQMKLRAASRSPEEIKPLVQEALKFLAEEPLQLRDESLAMGIGQAGEMTKEDTFIQETYQKLGKMFGEATNEKLQKFGRLMEGVARRLALLGKKIKLGGKLLNGDTLEMSKYKDKVVLVDFWATWCGPCVGEVPNVLKNYERYHDKGFDVIGISLDRSREPLEKFVKEKNIPWVNLYEDKEPNPAVEYYGILYIPTTLLLDKDGKVVSLNARGEELNKLLEKYLGPVEEKEEADQGKSDAEKKENADKPTVQ